MSFADNEVSAVAAAWLYPILGYADYNAAALDKAKVNAKRFLGALNQHLLRKTFLVGESVTLADIVLICHLIHLYTMVFDTTFRSEFANVNRWFLTCVNQPNFKAVIGEVKLAETMATYKKPEKVAPPKKEAPAPAAADLDEPVEEKPKGKNPLDLLPPSKLNMDEWKRMYSNNDTRPTAVNWFWDNFDAEGYSLWKVDYKVGFSVSVTPVT
jgi:elongation factor 1-gamma